MAESSSYGNSIKFYERVSDLQGELVNYETQQFHLEEEFQRLWTQGISHQNQNQSSYSSSKAQADAGPSSSTSAVVPVNDISGPGSGPAVHFTNTTNTGITGTGNAQGGHLSSSSQSQLLANANTKANPCNLNYYGKNDDVDVDVIRRRARNQALLDKLQELETNASIFAARSERLRMMRNEYETLVKKSARNRNRDNLNEPSIYYRNSRFVSSSTSGLRKSGSSSGPLPLLTSTGVNTDITGPIKPLAISTPANPPPDPELQNFEFDPTNPNPSSSKAILRPNPEMSVLLQDQAQDQDQEKLRNSIITSSRFGDIDAGHGHGRFDPGPGPIRVNNSNSNGFLTNDDLESSSSTAMTKPKPFTLRRPTFPDISSTSESDITVTDTKLKLKLKPKHQNQNQAENQNLLREHEHEQEDKDNADETSADTTSLSVLMPKSRFSNYQTNLNVNFSTDGSLSELTSPKQLPINGHANATTTTNIINTNEDDQDQDAYNYPRTRTSTNINRMSMRMHPGENDDGESRSRESLDAFDQNQREIRFINFAQAGGKYVHQNQAEAEAEEDDSRCDSTSHSVGDSLMDSVYNKTPESLPKDDSELVHITEADENEAEADEDQQDQDFGDQGQKIQKQLINEMGSQMKGNWASLSSSNLVRGVQMQKQTGKEKEIGGFGEGEMEATVKGDCEESNEKFGERSSTIISGFRLRPDSQAYANANANQSISNYQPGSGSGSGSGGNFADDVNSKFSKLDTRGENTIGATTTMTRIGDLDNSPPDLKPEHPEAELELKVKGNVRKVEAETDAENFQLKLKLANASRADQSVKIETEETEREKRDEYENVGHKEPSISSSTHYHVESSGIPDIPERERDGKAETKNEDLQSNSNQKSKENSFPATTSSKIATIRNNAKSGRGGRGGFSGKKLHLKLDYDDSESDSEKVVVAASSAKPNAKSKVELGNNGNNSTKVAKTQELDDEFDDFYI